MITFWIYPSPLDIHSGYVKRIFKIIIKKTIPQYYSQFDTVFILYSVDIGDKCLITRYYHVLRLWLSTIYCRKVL